MDEPSGQHKKTLHSKRSFGKQQRGVDSPAYDASEEDNETDDSASISSIPSFTRPTKPIHTKIAARRHPLASEDEGVDSPTYDGDVESSSKALASTGTNSSLGNHHHHHTLSSASSTSTLNTPTEETGTRDAHHPVFISQPHVIPPTPETEDVPASPNVAAVPIPMPQEPAPVAVSRDAFNPAALTPSDIQAFAKKAVDGETWRTYKINKPPTDRPIRIYADGVYDLFHFGHALALRQAKLSFPNVYLLVGVCSDELVLSHKAQTIMTHAERCEAARHCRWVDEIVQEAPWVLDQDFLDRWEIDYVAHDEDPYAAAGHEDVYQFVKDQGKFLPTRRTPGVSTSELLERIVSGYRNRDFDAKLVKMGHAELKAEGSDYEDRSRAGSRMGSRTTSRSISPVPVRLTVPEA